MFLIIFIKKDVLLNMLSWPEEYSDVGLVFEIPTICEDLWRTKAIKQWFFKFYQLDQGNCNVPMVYRKGA